MEKTMKVLNIVASKDCRIEERPIPQITEPNQVLIRVRAVGLCGSDKATYLGLPTRKLPLVPCHEFAGEIVQTGSEVNKFNNGDRVAVEPMLVCGECYACKSGRSNVCHSLKTVGSHCDGALQEYFLTTEDKLHIIPDAMSYRQATLIEPYTIGAQVNERLGTKKGDKMLIHGAGPIGIITMIVAKKIGAEVAISQGSAGRREFAKKLGADMVINPNVDDIDEKIAEFTDGKGADIIVDSAGVPELMTKAVHQAAVGGRLGNICFAQKEIELDIQEFVMKKLSIHGSRLQTNQFVNIIENFSDVILENDSIITDVFPLERAAEAFALLIDRNDSTCKIVIDC